jgi:diaminohydroxyphosphoribosylaminopyrimidine deaminase / 5-amino-6-(5-phosphoribosylamino)uracil reductase
VAEGLVDQVYAFLAPRLVGGRAAPTAVDGDGFDRLADALKLDLVTTRRLGPDILLEAVAA